MAYDAAVALKSLGNMNSSQPAKGRKVTDADDAAFGQALASASESVSDYSDQSAGTKVKSEGREPEGRAEAAANEEVQGNVQPEGTKAPEVTGEAEAQAVLAEKLAGVQAVQFMQAEQVVQVEVKELTGTELSVEGIESTQKLETMVQTEMQEMPEVMQETPENLVETEMPVLEVSGEPVEAKTVTENETEEVTGVFKAAEETHAEALEEADVPKEAAVTLNETSNSNQKDAQKGKVEASEVKAEALADKADMQTAYVKEIVSDDPVQSQSHVTRSGEMREEYADMLKDLIAKQIVSGKQEIELSLTPKSLGNLIVKVAYEAGETTVSIICTNQKAMQAMSQKAGELGHVLENSLGTRMEVVVETETRQQESYLYQDGRNGSGGQEEQEQNSSGQKKQQEGKEADPQDFLQQLRLGLA